MQLTVINSGKTAGAGLPPPYGLGLASATSELVGFTTRGVAFWQAAFGANGLPFSRVMPFERFAAGVRRFATVRYSAIVAELELMAPDFAKGFLYASVSDRPSMREALLDRLRIHKARRVGFMTKAAIGEDFHAEVPPPNEVPAIVFGPEVIARHRIARRCEGFVKARLPGNTTASRTNA